MVSALLNIYNKIMNLLINRLNRLIIDKKINVVYVFFKCINRRSECLQAIFPRSYSQNCTAAMQEDAKTQREERQIIFQSVYLPGTQRQYTRYKTYLSCFKGVSCKQLGFQAYHVLHFYYCSSFQRNISTVRIVKACKYLRIIGVAAKMCLQMGSQKS